jgi:hypothetical protein
VSWDNSIPWIRDNKDSHSAKLAPNNFLRKGKTGGNALIASAIVMDLCLTMLYRLGYWSLNEDPSSHVSSHNLTCDPFFMRKEP